jgi:hypothetical protein
MLGVLAAVCLVGCTPHEATYKVVANGHIFSVNTMTNAQDTWLEMDTVREILLSMGAAVDVDGADQTMAVAFPAVDNVPTEWPEGAPDAAYTIVFNEQILRTPYLDDEGRPYLPLRAFRSLCVAMGRRVSAPPYDHLFAIAPPAGEGLPTTGESSHVPTVTLPGKKGAGH